MSVQRCSDLVSEVSECTFGGVRTYGRWCPGLLSEVSVVIIGGVRSYCIAICSYYRRCP